jgi:hypothetical protein
LDRINWAISASASSGNVRFVISKCSWDGCHSALA